MTRARVIRAVMLAAIQWRRAQRHHPRLLRFDRHAGPRRHPGEPSPVRRGRTRVSARTGHSSTSRRRSSTSSTPPLGIDEAVQLVRDVDADVVLNGITGSVGLGTDARDPRARHARSRSPTRSRSSSAATSSPGSPRPGQIVPVDSEHSAIAQALRSGTDDEVRRLVLTASGGPFRGRRRDELAERDPRRGARAPDVGHGPRRHDELGDAREQGPRGHRGAPALRRRLRPHRRRRAPAVDRALDGRVHRRLDDRPGVAARHAAADLARARLAEPGRGRRTTARLDDRAAWTFEPLDDEAFPAVALAKQVGRAGGEYPAVFNAANEQAVAAFHAGRIGFTASSTPCATSSMRTRHPIATLTRRLARRRRTGGPTRRRRAHRAQPTR